jgi:hypothetical protein
MTKTKREFLLEYKICFELYFNFIETGKKNMRPCIGDIYNNILENIARYYVK